MKCSITSTWKHFETQLTFLCSVPNLGLWSKHEISHLWLWFQPLITDLYNVCIPASLEPTVWMWWQAVHSVWIWTQSTTPQIPSSAMPQSCSDSPCHFSFYKVHHCFSMTPFFFLYIDVNRYVLWLQLQLLTPIFPIFRVFSLLHSFVGAAGCLLVPQGFYCLL